ncbi:WXG100 family type VII secretion target [Streptomyces sp. NPDC000880]
MPDFTDGIIYVDYNHMSNAADDMISQTKAIGETLESLEMELNELMKTWEGDDASVYKQKQQAWDQALVNMEQMLSSHASLLTDISGNYQYSENSLAQMWSEVQIGR